MENPISTGKKMAARLLPLAALAGVLAGAAPAHAAWWKSEWTLRKKIVLDPTAVGGTGALGTGPALIRLFDGNFRFGAALPDAGDLRFVADDGKTLLPFHVERFDTLLNEGFVWVRFPEIKPATPTTIWLYYGNAKAAKAENAKGTFDENTVLAYHFGERSQPAYDATTNGNNALTAGLGADGSLIGGGLRLDGRTTVTIPATPTLAWTEGGTLTWSAWMKFGISQPNAVFFSRREGNRYFVIGSDNGLPYVEVSYQGSVVRATGGAAATPNTWMNLAVVAADGKISLYIDGQPRGAMVAPLPAMNTPMVLGGDTAGGAANSGEAGFTGEMDELEIAKAARSPGELRLATLNQGRDGAKLVTVGEDEQDSNWLSGLKTGYFGVIVNSLTVDGWVVIGVLAVMSGVSWIVMIRKAAYLRRVGRGNSLFLSEWGQIASDLSALEKSGGSEAENSQIEPVPVNPAMKHAPLYHIYHLGVAEIQHRLSAEHAGPDRGLSARSMQAIRATLDGGLVRETQRLNSQMVLLTIAISGGPFLGLLGTVVGVMITFAAVASAGEVNVNAIAPGIAAALLATVAGLGVAIPALFGYNYLLTQIKVAATDMHVFIDEFVTKLAEHYSEPGE